MFLDFNTTRIVEQIMAFDLLDDSDIMKYNLLLKNPKARVVGFVDRTVPGRSPNPMAEGDNGEAGKLMRIVTYKIKEDDLKK